MFTVMNGELSLVGKLICWENDGSCLIKPWDKYWIIEYDELGGE